MIGKEISHYTILEKLGEGGMGIVYKARDNRLERIVALKFLPQNVGSSSDELVRFEQEARAISALNHPSIATIHDFDKADGRTFLVLECIPGGTLKAKLNQLREGGQNLPIQEILRFGRQIADGLATAHTAGIVHRDVKTDNVMLTREGNAKLTDFGLAKLQSAGRVTQTGSTVGTAGYMSPEQIHGADVDHRTDIFSLGVVLYELTTQRLPFRGDHAVAMAYSIVNEEPAPVNSIRRDAPDALTAAIGRCLEKDPAKRYQTAAELARDLQAIESGQTPSTHRVPTARRRTLLWIATAALAIAGVVGLYLLRPWPQSASMNHKTIAVLPFTNVSGSGDEEYLSDGMTEDILTHLVKIADLKVISRTTVMQYKGVNRSVKDIGKELDAGVVLEGSIGRSGNLIRVVARLVDTNTDEYLWAETYNREFREVFAIQNEIAQKIASALEATLSPEERAQISRPVSISPDAYTAYLQGRYYLDRKGKEDIERAISFFGQALRIEPDYALAWVGLSLAHGTQADYSYVTVEEGYSKARKEGERALQLDSTIADAHTNMGWIRKNYDLDWVAADASFRRAVELEPRNAAALRGASSLAYTLGRFEEAISLGQRAIELDPLLPAGYYNLGSFEYYAGHLGKAEAAFKRAIALWPQYPVAHMWLGRVYLAQSRPDEALATILKEPDRLWRLQGLALAHHALGNKRQSGSALDELVREYHGSAGFQIAEVYAYRGEVDSAFHWLDRAFDQRDGGLAGTKGNPILRTLESDPRYGAFMKKIRLPQ